MRVGSKVLFFTPYVPHVGLQYIDRLLPYGTFDAPSITTNTSSTGLTATVDTIIGTSVT